MENKILGFAYHYYKHQFKVETYAVIHEDGQFLYRQLKVYEKVFDNKIIKEIENYGFKNMSYWDNYIIEIIREEKCKEVCYK